MTGTTKRHRSGTHADVSLLQVGAGGYFDDNNFEALTGDDISVTEIVANQDTIEVTIENPDIELHELMYSQAWLHPNPVETSHGRYEANSFLYSPSGKPTATPSGSTVLSDLPSTHPSDTPSLYLSLRHTASVDNLLDPEKESEKNLTTADISLLIVGIVLAVYFALKVYSTWREEDQAFKLFLKIFVWFSVMLGRFKERSFEIFYKASSFLFCPILFL